MRLYCHLGWRDRSRLGSSEGFFETAKANHILGCVAPKLKSCQCINGKAPGKGLYCDAMAMGVVADKLGVPYPKGARILETPTLI